MQSSCLVGFANKDKIQAFKGNITVFKLLFLTFFPDLLWVALSRVGTSQNVPSSFRAGYIFEYFPVLTSFRTSFQGSKTGLHGKVLDFSSTLLWKPVSKPVFIYQKPVYTRKYSKIRRSPSQGSHIPGCSGAISLHLHFRALPGINRFQINETGFETGF